MLLPDELNPELMEILGRPNFTCAGLASVLRVDGVDIARRAEHEQAQVLFKLLGFYAAHGDGWKKAAAEWIDSVQIRAGGLDVAVGVLSDGS
jgi:hypothetical protein